MIQHSIKTLYPFALAEGEGVGTAYEYYTKRLLLSRWLTPGEQPQRILIAGLPEKYGSSLDFLLLASEMGAVVTLADDRPEALAEAEEALKDANEGGRLTDLAPEYCLTHSMATLAEINERFDLVLSSETLQRIAEDDRKHYINRLLELASRAAIFTPNNDNPAHTNVSGLAGLRLDELETLVISGLQSVHRPDSPQLGYIDMPPFPPGISRTEEQRDQATSGKTEAIAMWGLGYYARLEQWLPLRWRRSKSHIVYALI